MADQEPDEQQELLQQLRLLRDDLTRIRERTNQQQDPLRQRQLRERQLLRAVLEALKQPALQERLERLVKLEGPELRERLEELVGLEQLDDLVRLEGAERLHAVICDLVLGSGLLPGSRAQMERSSELVFIHKSVREYLLARKAVESVAPISFYFDLDNFGPAGIADIIGLLSELYADVGGDGLVIDDVTLLDFQPALVPVEV
jgi:hypothetical protein